MHILTRALRSDDALQTITQVFVNLFKKQNSGHVIMLGSIAGKEAYAGGSIYTAT